MNENPYASPVDASPVSQKLDNAEAVRNEYIKHEASVKSIGTLYLLGAVLMVPISILIMVGAVASMGSGEANGADAAVMIGVGVFYLAIGLLQGFTAIGVRNLKPWARIVAIVFSVIGLLGVPIGTLISAYFLYLLLSEKGVFVFSEEYKRVIEQTPHIKYKTSKVIVVLLVILVALFALAMVAAVVGA